MNKIRRAELSAIYAKIEAFGSTLSELVTAITDVHDELETIRDEEQESYDNLPESLQNGERGSTMFEAVEYMDDAMSSLRPLAEEIETFDLSDILEAIDAASGPV